MYYTMSFYIGIYTLIKVVIFSISNYRKQVTIDQLQEKWSFVACCMYGVCMEYGIVSTLSSYILVNHCLGGFYVI